MNLLTRCAPISFSRQTLLHSVRQAVSHFDCTKRKTISDGVPELLEDDYVCFKNLRNRDKTNMRRE
jgi:hypothetical protein